MSNFEKFSKRIEILKLIIDIISVVVIGGCGVFLAFRANEIANYQTQVSMMEKNPYFEITAYYDNEQQIGYKITNIGGYIQDANIVLKGIVNINVNNCCTESFYFVYGSISKHFSNLKNDEISFSFNGNKLGINNWCSDDDIIASIIKGFENDNICATINYIEYLEISYLDFGKNISTEQYLIGMNQEGEYYLYSLPLENEGIEKGAFYESIDPSFYLTGEIIKELGDTTLGAGRKFDTNSAFVERILSTVRTHIKEIS